MDPVLKWRELDLYTNYGIIDIRNVKTRFGTATIGRLIKEDGWCREVWLPTRLADDIKGRCCPIYIYSSGLQQSNTNPDRKYFRYRFIDRDEAFHVETAILRRLDSILP